METADKTRRKKIPVNPFTIMVNMSWLSFLSVRDLLLQDSEKPSDYYFVGTTFSCYVWTDWMPSCHRAEAVLLPSSTSVCHKLLSSADLPLKWFGGQGGDTRPKLAANYHSCNNSTASCSLPDLGNSTTVTREARGGDVRWGQDYPVKWQWLFDHLKAYRTLRYTSLAFS